ncbi:tetratricopeptide repeat protein [Marinoscillum sp.]|uniref:ATP-binding protein n=1 Tax=Marinoscillum sp. TaxID=2024838 RepID=UPI003BA8AECA
MKFPLFLLALLLLAGKIVAQPQFDQLNADSLKLILSNAPDDTSKVNTALLLHDKYRLSDFTQAAEYAQTAYELSKKIHWNKGIALSANNHAVALSLTGKGDEAVPLLHESIRHARLAGDTSTVANCYMTLGNIEYDQTNYSEALPYYFNCFETYQSTDNYAGMSSALIWIGIIYQYAQEDYTQAINTYNEAMIYADMGKANLNKGYIASNLATIYYNQEQYDSAITYYQKGLEIKMKYNDSRGIANGYNNIANCYFDMKRYPEALELYNRSLEIRSELLDSTGIATSFVNIGKTYAEMGDNQKAIDLMVRGQEIASRIGYKEAIQESYLRISELEESNRNYQAALDNYKRYKELSDAIFNTSREEIISDLKTKYETEKKEQQIVLQSAEIAEQKAENQRNLALIVGLAAVITLLTIVLLLLRSRTRKKHALLIKEGQIKLRETQIEAAISSQESERSRFAKDLHDGFGQMISILNLNLKSLENESHDRHQVFEESAKVLEEMYQELKGICFNLMPQTLIKSGISAAIQEFAARVNTTGKVSLETDFFGLENRLTEVQEISLYRITQEWVNNILKYSDADKVSIQITKDQEEITLMIEDNGSGFDPEALISGKGNGWRNMNSRANLIKGELELDTTPGMNGNTLIVNAPVGEQVQESATSILS